MAPRTTSVTLADHATPPGGYGRLYDMAAAAECLGISHRHMQRLWAERRVAGVKIGGRVRFTQADLDAYIAARRVPAVQR